MYIQEASKFNYNSQTNKYQNSDNVEIPGSLDDLIKDQIKVIIWIDGEEYNEEWPITYNRSKNFFTLLRIKKL